MRREIQVNVNMVLKVWICTILLIFQAEYNNAHEVNVNSTILNINPSPSSSFSSAPTMTMTMTMTITTVCENWCSNHPVPWTDPDPSVNQKCRWPKTCGGCPECSTSIHESKCKPWCASNPNSWAQKCTWPKNCSECDECLTISSDVSSDISSDVSSDVTTVQEEEDVLAKGCENWCQNHHAPWFDTDPSVSQKCKWPKNCGGCPECSNIHIMEPLSSSPSQSQSQSPTSTPIPTLSGVVCEPWCSNNPTPWKDPDLTKKQKCQWALTCGGCPECIHDNTLVTVTVTPNQNPDPDPDPVQICKPWCANNPSPWRHPDPTVSQKCKWAQSCGGCSECDIDDDVLLDNVHRNANATFVPSVAPSSNTSPTHIVASVNHCATICVIAKIPWAQKCTWALACGGCDECLHS